MLALLMAPDEVKVALSENLDRAITITFNDGATYRVMVLSVDGEGFSFKDIDGMDELWPGQDLWAEFECVESLDTTEER
jgi:hypothetical protein